MSTHLATCVLCGAETACCEETHVLGSGGGCYAEGLPIEFCSLACFLELRHRLDERLAKAREIYPGWFSTAATVAV